VRQPWGSVKETIKHYTERDGREVMVGLEQEPGASGKALVYEMTKYLQGFPVQFVKPVRDKVTRARIWTGPAELGDISIKRADWNGYFLDECEMFPDGPHDDMVDAVSGGFNLLMSGHGIYI
jgi:predicted phage terminase large subunit-like protein